MRYSRMMIFSLILSLMMVLTASSAWALFGNKFKKLAPENGELTIPIEQISDGKAHYFKTKADDGTMVDFFVVKSQDGIIRAAIDACDVCFKSGKGYVQEGNIMVCTNCGRKFATDRINVVKGGCNPAPLNRVIKDDQLVISMKDINANAWYCQFK
ncbi:MAG: DUF2318 domain-containing protein [Desulfobacteraceae bacterium]|nr:DUF2318 domain-containing protein [Desulfobacteraceae bacterium]